MTTTEPRQRRLNQSYALVYAAAIKSIQRIGRNHGYAIAVHGSMATDFDIIACPWTEEATDAETLVEALRDHFQCVYFERPEGQPSVKPHGRLAWSMGFNPTHKIAHGGPYLDISVMPRISALKRLSAINDQEAKS